MLKACEVLKVYREAKQLSLRALADEIGVDHATLHRLEHGGMPSGQTLMKVVYWLSREVPHEE